MSVGQYDVLMQGVRGWTVTTRLRVTPRVVLAAATTRKEEARIG